MRKTDDAVSPVVGVMLMLVITIILAAVISGFASGVLTNIDTPSQATFTVSSTIEKISDTDKTNAVPDSPQTADNGIKFILSGGDRLFLDNLVVQFTNDRTQMQFDLKTISNGSIADAPVLTFKGENTYFSTGGLDYTELNAGDYFVLLADSCYDSTGATDTSVTKGKFLVWTPSGSKGSFEAQVGKDLQYSIIEKSSGNVLQRGTVRV